MKNKIFVTKPSLPDFKDYCNEIKDIWDNNWLTNMGPKHRQLEEKLKEYLDVDNVCLFNNGHTALEVAIESLDLPKGSEVITTPFTFASTTHAIVRKGLKPVFCDIDEENYTIDSSKIEDLISINTSLILPVHVYGNVCNVEEIDRISQKHNIKVIYDAAHVFGAKYKKNGVARYGDISMLSFHATKVFNTIEGGALCFSDTKLKTKIESIRDFGINSYNNNNIDFVGCNGKMNEFQASMGICNLKYINDCIAKRKTNFMRYISNLNNIDGIKLPQFRNCVEPNYAYLPIVFSNKYNRNDIYEKLASNNIFTRKYFYPLTSSFPCYDYNMVNAINLPVSKKISESVLCFPLYPDLTTEEIDYICNLIL